MMHRCVKPSFSADFCWQLLLRSQQTAIALKPRWKKGYFRAGAALFHLNQYAEALDMVRHCFGALPFASVAD